MSGYSDKKLVEKLGYKPSETVCLVQAPEWFQFELNRADVFPIQSQPSDWLHAFFSSHDDLESFLHSVDLPQIKKGLWVSWPKKSSGMLTNLTEQSFRDAILPLGWVDIKVCAIDDTWSGLKFARRKN